MSPAIPLTLSSAVSIMRVALRRRYFVYLSRTRYGGLLVQFWLRQMVEGACLSNNTLVRGDHLNPWPISLSVRHVQSSVKRVHCDRKSSSRDEKANVNILRRYRRLHALQNNNCSIVEVCLALMVQEAPLPRRAQRICRA